MAYIYGITNILTDKIYIGKTEKSIPEERFLEHVKDRKRFPDRPLYRAMNKYGVENFEFEVIEKTDQPEEREIYWISELNTYGSTGYNATRGGDGKSYLDHDKIIYDYSVFQNMAEVARKNNCDRASVRNILMGAGIKIIDSSEVMKQNGKVVSMLDKNTEEVLKTFPSQMAAARFLISNGYSKEKSAGSLSSKIGLVVKGKRITSCGFKWKGLE